MFKLGTKEYSKEYFFVFFVMGKKMKNSAGDIGVFKQKVLFML